MAQHKSVHQSTTTATASPTSNDSMSSKMSSDLPAIRATIFDMDGLLIDSEDAYTRVTNQILKENGRPPLPWTIKAQLQGRPGPAAGRIFQEWAKLPISTEEFMVRQKELQAAEFAKCNPLPGVVDLLGTLKGARTEKTGKSIKLAVATSSHRGNFEIKTARMKELFSVFPEEQVIVGDDPRVPKGRGKPLPDIYLLALQVLNDKIESEGSGEPLIQPSECLVFEDSVPGVEAGRRAGMRVIWCPHAGLLDVYDDRVEEVLAGRTGEHKESDINHADGIPLSGSPGKVGELKDGWAERLDTLEDFDYAKYGLGTSKSANRARSGVLADQGMTDKRLEEMCAVADGKMAPTTEDGNQLSVPGLKETNPKT